eukprot:Blabericola_migrator_1__2208@NODE_160_length_12527_cov_93_130417_g140_i0_p11_GENE_NODE_160_length_12527_cov_93_130417_g140_i0NODE_160_length_12527_cov_93_130417_g140_i0_p11_ORF_typecomplete_len128_score23_15Microtub_bd/PF16796_5/7e05_NODE_160_length_12527_cov_93_130417_g140_i035418
MIRSISSNGNRCYASIDGAVTVEDDGESYCLSEFDQESLHPRQVAEEDGRVRVYVRLRDDPSLSSGGDPCVLKDPRLSSAVVYVPSKAVPSQHNFQGQKFPLRVFNFDDVLEPQTSQAEVRHIDPTH